MCHRGFFVPPHYGHYYCHLEQWVSNFSGFEHHLSHFLECWFMGRSFWKPDSINWNLRMGGYLYQSPGSNKNHQPAFQSPTSAFLTLWEDGDGATDTWYFQPTFSASGTFQKERIPKCNCSSFRFSWETHTVGKLYRVAPWRASDSTWNCLMRWIHSSLSFMFLI